MIPSLVRRCLSEVAGTFLLVGIGTGGMVAGAEAGGVPQWGLAVAWFVAVSLPIVLCIRISGAHLNPVVTGALAMSGRIAPSEAPVYWAGQLIGAFLGSLSVAALVGRAIHIGATLPANGDLLRTFLSELAFTALLVVAVFVLADRGEGRRRWRLLLPGGVVALATIAIGPWTGSSLNPARSIAPAVLSGTYDGLWVYLVATVLAGAIMAVVWKPRAVDRLDRGPGRATVDR
ncbi:MAG: aquaporin [Thermoplasmata archaeon]|nr:aquaporin [Thermoplasmata archaeon]